MRLAASIILATLLASCAAQQQPADPQIVAKIERICTASGYFKLINGAIALAYPPAAIPVEVFNKGIDQVCMHPETFAQDVSTVEWLLRNLPHGVQ